MRGKHHHHHLGKTPVGTLTANPRFIHTYMYIYIYINHTYICRVLYLQTFYAYMNVGMYLTERCKNVTSITAVKLTIFKAKHPEIPENLFSLTNTFSFSLFITSLSCKTQNHFVSWQRKK